jgi:SAM-dependent methyltransferase
MLAMIAIITKFRALQSFQLAAGIALALIAVTTVRAQSAEQRAQCEREYSPQSGQPGKDVIWIPTPDRLVKAMLEAVNTKADDIVYDLGAGDGKIAIAAARDFGARAVGVEYNPKMVKFATCLAQAAGLSDRVKMIHGDVFKVDFSEATVVTMYLLPELNVRLAPTILKMKPGTRVVSHSFMMGDWEPDNQLLVLGVDRVYQWIVPAHARGTWELQSKDREPLTLKLKQKYQTLDGVLVQGKKEMKIQDAYLRGDQIFLKDTDGRMSIKGTISQDEMTVAVSGMGETTTYAGKRR